MPPRHNTPVSIITCPTCNGEGEIGSGVMSHTVNSATIDPPWEVGETCPTCNGARYIEGKLELRTLDDLEQEDAELAF